MTVSFFFKHSEKHSELSQITPIFTSLQWIGVQILNVYILCTSNKNSVMYLKKISKQLE